MATTSSRPIWPVLASLGATALLSFLAGAMVTAWLLAGEQLADGRHSGRQGAHLPFETVAADEPGRLRLALAPAERIGAAEAALLAPEIFPPAAPDEDEGGPSEFGAVFTVQLGTFLLPEQAEAARGNAEALGFEAVTRLLVDVRGRAWYSVQAGRYGDRLSAAQAARWFDGAHPAVLDRAVAFQTWSRG
ncbi:MAG: SPOR domain-containing protein [Magnetospirillum sp.]|nr:SPOR domain-containing protein [Magnetospirillum sp.]